MRTTKIVFSFLLGILCCSMSKQVSAQRKMEQLDRGVLAVTTDNSVYVGWRIPATELRQVSYNIYRDGVKINSDPITGASNYRDDSGTTSSHYAISAIVDGVEQAASAEVPV